MSVSFLKRLKTYSSEPKKISPFVVDVHSHILPGLDNGSESIEDTVSLLREMSADGIKKVIATPHIMGDFYTNTTETINRVRDRVLSEVFTKNIPISIEMSAEYFLDVSFVALIESNKPLLTFGAKYLLFETTMIGLPSFLEDATKRIQEKDLKPVMAHPERYYYLQQNYELAHQLHESGILFQINTTSLQSQHLPTRSLAEYLISENLTNFMGSNTHNRRDWAISKVAVQSKYYALAVEKGLLNQELL